MPKKQLLGLIKCGECGFADAEVRPDKNGSPYWWCPDCNVQVFARGDKKRADNIVARMRPVAPAAGDGSSATPASSVTPPAAPAAAPAPAAPPAAPAKAERKNRLLMG
jgi:hypothetical protein